MRDESRIIVTNTTPIIALSIIGRLGLLEKLYGTVFLPPAVENEIRAGYQATRKALAEASFIQVKALADPGRADLLSDLDRGEAEAITLTLELKDRHDDHLLIIDERLGRRHARRLGLAITGTLGVLLRAKSEGHIQAIRPLIDQLLRGGIYLSDKLVALVMEMAGE